MLLIVLNDRPNSSNRPIRLSVSVSSNPTSRLPTAEMFNKFYSERFSTTMPFDWHNLADHTYVETSAEQVRSFSVAVYTKPDTTLYLEIVTPKSITI